MKTMGKKKLIKKVLLALHWTMLKIFLGQCLDFSFAKDKPCSDPMHRMKKKEIN
jgi:hypothetical protein